MADAIKPVQPENEPKKLDDIFDFGAKKDVSTPETPAPAEAVPEIKPAAAPETTVETQPAKQAEVQVEDEQSRRQYAPPPADEQPVQTVQPAQSKSEELIKIENILSEHMDEFFVQMNPQQQMAFQQKGEETATKVEVLLQQTKVKVKEIFDLIRDWLKLIPGINKFFLEQEAKIKTDRVLNMKEQKK